MKAKQLVVILVWLMMLLSACREINVRTTVNKDGSLTRVITVTGDSSEAFKKELPYPVDGSWAMTSKKDTAGEGRFIVTYTKTFNSAEELQAEIGQDTSWFRQLERHTGIGKRFGLFYSYLEYIETYAAANPFTALPYQDYLTPEDYLWVTRRHPVMSASDSTKRSDAEEKVMDYLVASAAAEVEKTLAEGIRKLGDPSLDSLKMDEIHGRIAEVLSKGNFMDEKMWTDSLRIWTGNSAIDRLGEIQPPLFRDFIQKARLLEQLLIMEEFRVETEMPGLITATNSSMLHGNRVSWDLFPMEFLLEDYSMVVESRVINVWAFVLAGVVVLGLLVVLTAKTLFK